jgi:hypothetical protein
LLIAALQGHLEMVRCLIVELHADANQANRDGVTPLYLAVQGGHLAIVKFLVKEFNADINQATLNGQTPLMAAALSKRTDVIKYLIKAGADTQASLNFECADYTAANVSRVYGAPAEQTAYLEAKTHCSHPGCSGTGCRQARYCGAGRSASWPIGRRTRPTASGGARSCRGAQGMQASNRKEYYV